MINDLRDQPEKNTEADGESSLKRWSQRKARVRAETLRKNDDLVPAPEQQSPSESKRPGRDAAVEQKQELTDADMPPLDSLDENSDLSPFFSPKVSASLRRLALRKIFHLPAYNIRDGLNDYDEDYTLFEPLGDVVTADMRHMQEVAEKRRREQEQLAEAEVEQQTEEKADDGLPRQDAEQTATDSADEMTARELPASSLPESERDEEQRDDNTEKTA